jgi:hypothetical protein
VISDVNKKDITRDIGHTSVCRQCGKRKMRDASKDLPILTRVEGMELLDAKELDVVVLVVDNHAMPERIKESLSNVSGRLDHLLAPMLRFTMTDR